MTENGSALSIIPSPRLAPLPTTPSTRRQQARQHIKAGGSTIRPLTSARPVAP